MENKLNFFFLKFFEFFCKNFAKNINFKAQVGLEPY